MELLLLIPVVAITAFVAVKIARLRATRPEPPSADVTARLEALERELAETQERLDFAERLLTKAREERRIGS
jgi:uncharacterized protein YceH (UPF0502 family)